MNFIIFYPSGTPGSLVPSTYILLAHLDHDHLSTKLRNLFSIALGTDPPGSVADPGGLEYKCQKTRQNTWKKTEVTLYKPLLTCISCIEYRFVMIYYIISLIYIYIHTYHDLFIISFPYYPLVN